MNTQHNADAGSDDDADGDEDAGDAGDDEDNGDADAGDDADGDDSDGADRMTRERAVTSTMEMMAARAMITPGMRMLVTVVFYSAFAT